MYRVFAVDPDTVSRDGAAFRATAARFGIEHGRIIADFPDARGGQDWLTIVAAKIKASHAAGRIADRERATLMARLAGLRQAVHAVPRRFTRGTPWIANALRAHNELPWPALLTDDETCDCEAVLRTFELDDSQGLFAVRPDPRVPATGAMVGELLRPLLEHSNRLDLIDPYLFKDGLRLSTDVVPALIAMARGGRVPAEIVIHTRLVTDRGTPTMSTAEFSDYIVPFARNVGMQIKMIRWDDSGEIDRLHGRYILTNLGGVRVDPGLDPRAGSQIELHRLSREMWDRKRQEFDPIGGDHLKFDEVEVR
jgi:hypothetical protein